MSDTNTEKKGFWARLFGSIGKIDETLHEKPIRRIEDLFALIGLGAVVHRSQTFLGAFMLILGYILRGGAMAWGWSETQMSEVRTMLNTWTPLAPNGEHDSLIVIAVRRLFDFQHLYRWLIVLGGMGVFLSLGIWMIVAMGWVGFVMFMASLAFVFMWSIMSRTSHVLIVPLLSLLIIGGIILILSFLPNAGMWMMVFAILTSIASMAVLGVVFWPISVVARWFSSPKTEETSEVTETTGKKKKAKDKGSLGNFIAGYIVVLCWPVSLMVSAIMFNVWANTQSQAYYMTILVILLSLGLFGIRKEGIRKVLNTAAVSNLFVYLIIVAYGWMVPVDTQASLKYQTNDYKDDIVGVYAFRTDAKYYWDVNHNSMPDSTDLKYLKDALADSTLFPGADRRYADVNGDGASNGADTVYFRRFMDKTGPKPVKATWLGTPKPRVLATAPLPKESGSVKDSSDSLSTGQVAETESTLSLTIPSSLEEGIEVPVASGKVKIEVSGTVDIGRGQVGPEGEPGYWDTSVDSYQYDASLKDHVGGCEIIIGGQLENGHIVGGTRMLVGRVWEGNISGPARLRVIESRNGYHDGNTGNYSAVIRTA